MCGPYEAWGISKHGVLDGTRCRYSYTAAEKKCRDSYSRNWIACNKSYKYEWSGSRNVLKVTTGIEHQFGWHFPTFNLVRHNKMRVYLPKEGDLSYYKEAWLGTEQGTTWIHVTAALLEQAGDSADSQHKMSLRINGEVVLEDFTNNISKNYNLNVWASNFRSTIATIPMIDDHKIHNLRMIRERRSNCTF